MKTRTNQEIIDNAYKAGFISEKDILLLKRRLNNKSFGDVFPYFEGGVGMSCYSSIAAFLGGKMEHVADTKTYDKYVFTFK